MAIADAGARVPCPGCGQTVLHKAMIPIAGPGGQPVSYLCAPCARCHVVSRAG